MRDVSISALIANAPPVCCWQSVQWQQCVNIGRDVSRKRTAPHEQPPSNVSLILAILRQSDFAVTPIGQVALRDQVSIGDHNANALRYRLKVLVRPRAGLLRNFADHERHLAPPCAGRAANVFIIHLQSFAAFLNTVGNVLASPHQPSFGGAVCAEYTSSVSAKCVKICSTAPTFLQSPATGACFSASARGHFFSRQSVVGSAPIPPSKPLSGRRTSQSAPSRSIRNAAP